MQPEVTVFKVVGFFHLRSLPLKSVPRPMWAACTGTRISRSLQSGLEISCGPKWKLRTRPSARNISCRPPPPPPPARRPGCPQLIILRRLRLPLRKVRDLIRWAILPRTQATLPDTCHPHRPTRSSRDRGGRAAMIALVLTVSPISLVASAGDDDPIRLGKTAISRLQRGWARGCNVARRRVQIRLAVPRSDRGRGTRAVYDCTPCHSPVCDFRPGFSLSSAEWTEGEPSEGMREV